MIIFKPGDFLLKPKITLYNNIARSGKCKGRLLAELEIYPSPRLTWDFETLGKTACEPDNTNGLLKESFIGDRFRMNRPYLTSRSQSSLTSKPTVRSSGFASQAISGDLKFNSQTFSFCIPNARFQEANLVGQGTITENLRATVGDESWEVGEAPAGRIISVPLDDYWQIHLETRLDALDWLKRNRRNIGTYVTTIGLLSLQKRSNRKKSKRSQTMILDEAIHRLRSFSLLLSFANGGYTGPLYVEGYRIDRIVIASGEFLVSRITPLEQLGASWLTIASDLTGFLKCFSAFERMGDLPHWKDEFDLILAWYFQAIQPQSLQMGKPWPVVANAIGTALERLCVLILVNDLGIRGLSSPADRIKRLLEQMGITRARGCPDVKHIKDLIDIRNDATHPRSTSTLTDQMREHVLDVAIQWLEEALLWRLGYNGKYRDRIKPHYASTEPRYDLTARNPSW